MVANAGQSEGFTGPQYFYSSPVGVKPFHSHCSLTYYCMSSVVDEFLNFQKSLLTVIVHKIIVNR